MPTFDAVSLSAQTTTTTITWSHTTTTTANRIGIVSVIASTANPITYTAFTWGGVAPNIYFSGGGASGQLVGVWFDPPTGTQTISCGVGGSTPMRGQAVTYSDVVGLADVNRLTVSSAGAQSVAVTAAAGQTSVFMGQLAAASGAATWASTNGTIRSSHTAGGTNQSAGFISEQTGTGTVTGSSTSGGTVPSGGIIGFVLVGSGQQAAFVSGYYALGTGTHSVATTPGSRSTTSPLTFNAAPVAASDAYTVAVVQAVVSTGTNANATMSATWGGVAMTQQSLLQLGATTSRAALATFTLVNPGTGTKSVVVTVGAVTTSQIIAGTAVFRNVFAVNNATSAATTGITVTSDTTSAIATGHTTANTSGYTAQANKVPGWVSVTSVTGTGDGFIMMLDAGANTSVTNTPGGTGTTPGSVGLNLLGFGGTSGAAISTLTEDFATISGAIWSNSAWTASAGTAVSTANTTCVMSAIGIYSLTSGAMLWQQVNAASTGTDYVECGFNNVTNDFWGFRITGTTVSAEVNNTLSGPTRTHTNNDWYQVREASGTMFFEYSTDPTNIGWTTLHSTTTLPNRPDRLQPVFATVHSTGTVTATVDKINIPPSITAVASDFFRMF